MDAEVKNDVIAFRELVAANKLPIAWPVRVLAASLGMQPLRHLLQVPTN